MLLYNSSIEGICKSHALIASLVQQSSLFLEGSLSLSLRLISRELFNFQGLAAARSLSVESSLIVLASDQVLREGGGRDNEWRFSGNFEARLQ